MISITYSPHFYETCNCCVINFKYSRVCGGNGESILMYVTLSFLFYRLVVTIRGITVAETGRGAGTVVTVATETCTTEVVVVVVVIIVGTTQEEVEEEEEEETIEAAVIEVLVSIIIIWFLCTCNFFRSSKLHVQ